MIKNAKVHLELRFLQITSKVAAKGCFGVQVASHVVFFLLFVQNIIKVAGLPLITGIVTLNCVKKSVVHAILLSIIVLFLKFGCEFN